MEEIKVGMSFPSLSAKGKYGKGYHNKNVSARESCDAFIEVVI